MKKLILCVALFAALATAFSQQDPEEFSLGGFPLEDEEFSMTGFPDEEFSLMSEDGTEDIAMTEAMFAKEDAEVDLTEAELIRSYGRYRRCKRRCRRYFKYSYQRYQMCKRRCRRFSGQFC